MNEKMRATDVVIDVGHISLKEYLLEIRNELAKVVFRKENYDWKKYSWYIQNLKGAFAGWILVISFIFSYASIIFTSHPSLEPYLTVGINQILLSYCIGTTINAIFGDTYFGISGPNTTVALFLAIAGKNFDSGFPTYLVFAAMLTVLYGLSMAITGWLSVGTLFLSSKVAFPEYLHPCLVGGISLGAAWYFFQYGVVITTGISFNGYSDIDNAMTFHNFALTGPAIVIAVISLLLKRTGRTTLALISVFAAVPLFYIILYGSGSDIDAARKYGWLYHNYSYTPAWEIWTHWDMSKVSGIEIAKVIMNLLFLTSQSLPTLVLADIVLVVEYLLVLQGMQLLIKESTDYDKDFRANGYACIASGLAGGLGGHHAFAESVIIHQNGGSSRFAPAVTVVLNLVALMVGYSAIVSYIPRFVLAATIIDLGFLFISTWLYDKYFEFERYEWLLSVAIMFLVLIFGFGYGVCIGLLICIIINSFTRRTTVIGAVSYKDHYFKDCDEKKSDQE